MRSRTARGSAAADRAPLLEALGVELDPELVELALTHRSYAYENGGLPPNERLEFLGDAVLGVVVTEHLYRTHPDLPEGQLAKLRSSVVNMHALAGVARELGQGGLGMFLLLGRGEELTGGRDKASILADAMEAVIGAVHLAHGIDTARGLVHRLFGALLQQAPQLGAGLDWKTSLQELTAVSDLGVPEYRVSESGPDHLKRFTAVAVIAGKERGAGEGRTKKEAEQQAAAAAWRALSPSTAGASAPVATDRIGHDGLATDGLATDGLAADGLATDGLAADGLAADGLATGGVANRSQVDTQPANGARPDGLAADGRGGR